MLANRRAGPVQDTLRGGAKGAMTGLGAAAGIYFAGEHGNPLANLERSGRGHTDRRGVRSQAGN